MPTFTVYGTPVPQGSKKGFVVNTKGGGQRAIVTEQAGDRLKTWRGDIKDEVRALFPTPILTPVLVELEFHMPRPKTHYVAGDPSRPLKKNAPFLHTGTPDGDKLTRAVLDALTQAGAYLDDSKVCDGGWLKRYADPGMPAKTIIRVEAIESMEQLEELRGRTGTLELASALETLSEITAFVEQETDPSRSLVHGSMLHIARLLSGAREAA